MVTTFYNQPMRYLAILFVFCACASAQVQYEAEQLYRNAALHAFGNLAQLELNATITLSNEGMKPVPKIVSIVVDKPDNFYLSTKVINGAQTTIVSGGNLWVENSYYRQQGTRKGELRPGAFPIDPGSREVVPRDWPLVSARVAGMENLLIEGRTFATKKIEVTLQTPGPEGPAEQDATLWVEEKSGVPLKQIVQPRTAHGTHIEVVVTRFQTEGPMPVDVFKPKPAKDSVDNSAVFSRITSPTGSPLDSPFESSSGAPLTRVDLLGQPAILVFGRPECKACADESAEFEAAAKLRANAARAFRIAVGSSSGAPSNGARKVFASSEQMERFGIQILPATVALAPDGRIAGIEEGFITADEMVALAEKARTLPPVSPVLDAGYFFTGQPGVVAPVAVYKAPIDRAAWVQAGEKSGEVVLSVVVAKDGSVMRVNVVRSSNSELNDIAVEAARKWTFKPGSRDGQAANVAAPVSIRFGSK
jgi:TonB family protein